MKKNILIIGYGDIAKRLDGLVNKDKYELYGVSRTNKDNRIKNHIKWDWLSTKTPKLKNTIFDAIIFLPKPSSMDESGYNDGFTKSSKNIFSFIKEISFKKFITISSTRVYGKDKKDVCLENGAGHGLFVEGFSKNFDTVLVVDFSLSYLILTKKICEEKKISNIFLLCANVEKLPFKNNLIDLVHSNNVIEHVTKQDKMINEINRVLSLEGLLFLLSPNKNSAYFEPHFTLPFYGFLLHVEVHLFLNINLMKGKLNPLDNSLYLLEG